jgi:hypothetical protein
MSPAHDLAGIADGRAMLALLPNLYTAALTSAQLEQRTDGEVFCSFILPSLGRRTKTAATAVDAIRACVIDIFDTYIELPLDEWSKDWELQSLMTTVPSAEPLPVWESERAERFQSKSRQHTVGVTLPTTLKASLNSLAEQQNTSFAGVARQLVAMGYDSFDDRSFSEDSKGLLSQLASEVGRWFPSETEQIMLRLDPYLAVRLRASAKEYRKSASEFGTMCMAHGLVLQNQVIDIELRVAGFRGAALRRLSPQVGLEDQVALLSGILAGSTRAPKKVLRRLSEIFETTEFALTDFFRLSFESRPLPAFKAEKGKPQVSATVVSWENAVKSLNLPADQTMKFLQLDE